MTTLCTKLISIRVFFLLTGENRIITIFSNLIFLSSSEGSYESAHGHILARTLTALKREMRGSR